MADAHSSANDLQRKWIMASAMRVAAALGRLTELSYLRHSVICHVDTPPSPLQFVRHQ